MATLVNLEYYGAQDRNYYACLVHSSRMDSVDHYHNYYQVCYVEAGWVRHFQSGGAVDLHQGDAFIIPPGVVHRLEFFGSDCRAYSVAFLPNLFSAAFSQSNGYRFLSQILKEDSARMRIALTPDQGRIMTNCMESLVLQQQITPPESLSAAPSLVESIVYLLAQSYYRRPQNLPLLTQLTDYKSAILRCLGYIDGHFREPLTLGELARHCGLSRSTFSSVFPQFAGMTLTKYISQKRILEAQNMIRSNPDTPMGQIARQVGYEDDSTFYRNFLRVTELSPSQFRQRCLEES